MNAGGPAAETGQHRSHVGVADVNGGVSHDRPAQLLEGVAERVGQTLRVGITVVDGGGSRQTEVRVRIVGHRLALHLVVVGGAQVARVPGDGGIGQDRRGVGGRDHEVASLRNHLRHRHAGAGAARSDNADDGRIGHDLLAGCLAAFSITAVVLGLQLDVVSGNLAAELHGDLDAVLRVGAQVGIRAGDDQG
jgi:hypothetical protein